MIPRPIQPHRRAAILVIVVGIAALSGSLALVFLLRMQQDVEDSSSLMREAQARTMVSAALQYIQETARMGWDRNNPARPGVNDEAYGWIDVRDGSPGPKDHWHEPLAAFDPVTGAGPVFPGVGGKAARCPMFVMERAPCAVEMTVNYNPISTDFPGPMPTVGADNEALSPYWRSLLSYANPEPRSVSPDFASWRAGDRRARLDSEGMSWFRCYRMTQADCQQHRKMDGTIAPIHWSPAVFIITCGAGATRGYRDWDEIPAEDRAQFNDDPNLFNELRDQESILWYACEWHPSQANQPQRQFSEDNQGYNRAHYNVPWNRADAARAMAFNLGGVFLWIERLSEAPVNW
jgi:hypothetical protein